MFYVRTKEFDSHSTAIVGKCEWDDTLINLTHVLDGNDPDGLPVYVDIYTEVFPTKEAALEAAAISSPVIDLTDD